MWTSAVRVQRRGQSGKYTSNYKCSPKYAKAITECYRNPEHEHLRGEKDSHRKVG